MKNYEEKPQSGFVVKDKRRFDSEGNERDENQKKDDKTNTLQGSNRQPAEASLENSISEQKKDEEKVIAHESESVKQENSIHEKNTMGDSSRIQNVDADGIDFASFVISLAQQALWQLGVIDPPEGINIPVDKQAAKETISILSMLSVKTKGNLDSEEATLLENILHELRLGFLKA
jgi:hypothetical protein